MLPVQSSLQPCYDVLYCCYVNVMFMFCNFNFNFNSRTRVPFFLPQHFCHISVSLHREWIVRMHVFGDLESSDEFCFEFLFLKRLTNHSKTTPFVQYICCEPIQSNPIQSDFKEASVVIDASN
jgi:hypothetical protein